MKAPYYIYETANTVRRAENLFENLFELIEQKSSRIRVSEQNFEQNKRFLRALPADTISHFTSRSYPSLPFPSSHRFGMACVRPYRDTEDVGFVGGRNIVWGLWGLSPPLRFPRTRYSNKNRNKNNMSAVDDGKREKVRVFFPFPSSHTRLLFFLRVKSYDLLVL